MVEDSFMDKVVAIRVLSDYAIEAVFDDGVSGVVSLKERLYGPMFEPLRDPAFFGRARIDAFGAICWPNGADLAPDALYDTFKSKEPWQGKKWPLTAGDSISGADALVGYGKRTAIDLPTRASAPRFGTVIDSPVLRPPEFREHFVQHRGFLQQFEV
jgi:hypothetical protein